MIKCAEKCVEHEIGCPNKECRMWVAYKDDYNCVNIAVERYGKMTLREVSKRLGVSFVRIKQIQDKALSKLPKNKDFCSFFEL